MKKEKISKGTIARTVILALAIINSILTAKGCPIIPIADETIAEFISLVFLIGSSIVAWWKNNSFTKKAIKADNYRDIL